MIQSKAFKDKYRLSDKYFTRNRKLSFEKTILIMLNSNKKTIQLEVNAFYKSLANHDLEVNKVTSSAFLQSKDKIDFRLFKDSAELLNNAFYEECKDSLSLYKNFRLLAIDGSKIKLPVTQKLLDQYGGPKNQNDVKLVSGTLSCLYDIENDLILDCNLGKYDADERQMAIHHFDHCNETEHKDLLILDRGYPSFEIMEKMESLEINFLIRSKKDFNKEIKSFVLSESKDIVLELNPSSYLIKKREFDKTKNIKIRLIKLLLETGEEEILITNLLDTKDYPYEIFKDLYFKRWKIETCYDMLKNIFELESFSGYKINSIKQDIYVTVLLKNLQSLLSKEIEPKIKEKYKQRHYAYKINNSIALGTLKENFLDLFLSKDPEDIKEYMLEVFAANVVPIRLGRHNVRDKNLKKRRKAKVPKNRKRVM